jgi:hypothetical protein
VLGKDDADDWVRSWSHQMSGCASAATALADRICVLTATATGADRAIRVTVGSSGAVTGLELDDRVRRMTGAELSEEILRAMRRAQSNLVDRVAEAVEETAGTDTQTSRAVLDSYCQRFPPEPDESPASPVMPSPPPFPSFPNLPQQSSGGGRGPRAS